MRFLVVALALGLGLGLTGCVSTAVAIVKAPFQLAGAAVDGLTTSQEEADRNRGRALRKQEEEEARSARRIAKERRRAAREAAEDDG